MVKKILFLFLILLLAPVFIFALDKININTATLSQLDKLTEIGPVMAQRIIDARPFSSIDDLAKVKGIGEKTLQKIKDQGLAYTNEQTQPTAQQIITPDTNKPATSQSIDVLLITYPSGVFINEILPNPKGSDGTDEWIELYNSNNFIVDLSGWQIQDTAGTPKTFTISAGTKILANGFLVFKRPDTKIMLNNEGDGINFLTPDKKILDSVTFSKAPLGQSYNKTASGWGWSTTLTPDAKNIITSVIPKSSSKTLSKTKNSVKNNTVEPGLADLTQNLNQDDSKTNPWFLFFIVLGITIVLAIIVLLIKIRFRKGNKLISDN